jgi:hypothetical protein
MAVEVLRRPDEVALTRDLKSGRFLIGVASGRWRLVWVQFPHVLITVRASDGVDYGLRFECSDYPRSPITAQLWDVGANRPLEFRRWPRGNTRIPLAFNPTWKSGTCLYIPCDRLSIEGHDMWRVQHPALLWEPAKGISKYLGIVHQLLNSGEYGAHHAAAA